MLLLLRPFALTVARRAALFNRYVGAAKFDELVAELDAADP
jgi:hypothetical protein